MASEWVPSEFTLSLMAIAKEEGTLISKETFQEVDMLVSFEIPSDRKHQVYAMDINTDTLQNLLSLTQDCLALGGLVFEKVATRLGIIGAAAGIIKDLITLGEPDKPDPVMEKLEELEYQLGKLSEKMTNHFDDLKSFVVEQSFYEKYTLASGKLFKYMLDTVKDPSEDSREEFEDMYKKHSPKELVYEMLTMIEQDKSNPLKWAMDSDKLKKTSTFNKWTGILDCVLTQALFLETFASGLLAKPRPKRVEHISTKIAEFIELKKSWDKYYKSNPVWWKDGVKQLVEKVQDDSSLDNNRKKADAIWKEIADIHTDDLFYLVVFGDHIAKWTIGNEEKVLHSWRNGYHAFVYRTPTCSVGQMESAKCVIGWFRCQHRYSSGWIFDHWQLIRNFMTQKRIDDFSGKLIGNNFFLVVAQEEWNVTVRHKTDGVLGEGGPGWYTYQATLKVHDGFTSSVQKMLFLTGVG